MHLNKNKEISVLGLERTGISAFVFSRYINDVFCLCLVLFFIYHLKKFYGFFFLSDLVDDMFNSW